LKTREEEYEYNFHSVHGRYIMEQDNLGMKLHTFPLSRQ